MYVSVRKFNTRLNGFLRKFNTMQAKYSYLRKFYSKVGCYQRKFNSRVNS